MARETRTGGREATTAVIPGKFAFSIGNPGHLAPDGFAWRPLSELARLESGHTPSRSKPEYWDGGIPWIGVRDATGNHGLTIADTLQHISQLGLDNSSARLLPAGTVCLSRTASVGYVVTMGVPMATSQDFVNWVCGPELDNRYLHYLLMGEQASVQRVAYGSVHATMYYPDAKAVHVCVPSRRMQGEIADVLRALDDKIAANIRLATTVDKCLANRLEALLKQWDGESVSLSEVALINPEKRSPIVEGHLRYIDIASVGVGSMEWPELQPWESAPSRARRGVAVGDVIWSTVRPNRRSHALILDEDPDLVASTGLAVIRASGLPWGYLYEALRRSSFTEHLEGAAEGSAYPAVKPEAFARASIPILDDTEVRSFGAEAQALREHIGSLARESRTLRDLRDTLLPQLMLGKLRVREAAEMAGL
ncbi:restriction endonuclease subunit S [Cellulosimicrobium protaetiae]|uniref:Restriction endonuclease subunit S n=1 Tax=Cellulosimicrobium protaetiae TaxID=2587808 RepID=A0A6M5UGV7_9MICO|nr:restriction endonuclease subunit S [Cellulosimicrobium protaetiae]QJW37380.1 restriction endonuclease subunit S [Cellulosimicrobium protaetiae]